jgi:hypothetical protein
MPSTFRDRNVLPSLCECPQTYHTKHQGHPCGASETLYPMPFADNKGKPGILWLCEWCHKILCLEGKENQGKRIPIT